MPYFVELASPEDNDHPTLQKVEEILQRNDFTPSFIKSMLDQVRWKFSLTELDDYHCWKWKYFLYGLFFENHPVWGKKIMIDYNYIDSFFAFIQNDDEISGIAPLFEQICREDIEKHLSFLMF